MKKSAYIIILIILIVFSWYAYNYFTKKDSSLSISANSEEIEKPAVLPENKNLDAIDTTDLEKEMKSVDEELNNL